QPLEPADIAVDRRLEVAVRAVALADLVERLLALQRVEPPREHVALAALVAFPQLGRRVRIDHPGDVDRDRVERLDAVPARRLVRAPGLGPLARRAGEEVGQPAIAAAGAAGRAAALRWTQCGAVSARGPGAGRARTGTVRAHRRARGRSGL